MVLHKKTVLLPSFTAVKCGSVLVPPSTKCKYLGLHIDESLSFINHIQCIRTDISRKLGAFCRGRNSLDNKARKALIFIYLSFKAS